jgi:hypothetical protein
MVFVVPGPTTGGSVIGGGGGGSSGPTTQIAYPSSANVLDTNASPNTGESTPIVYGGLGQVQLSGFWNAGSAGGLIVATEVNGGQLWPYIAPGFVSDNVGANQQFLTLRGAVPGGFTEFSAPFEWSYRYVADTGPDVGRTATLTLAVLDPNTGAVAASATRVLGDEGPFDAAYVTLSIPAATMNAIGFVAGDPFVFYVTQVMNIAGAGERATVNLSKITIPWS